VWYASSRLTCQRCVLPPSTGRIALKRWSTPTTGATSQETVTFVFAAWEREITRKILAIAAGIKARNDQDTSQMGIRINKINLTRDWKVLSSGDRG
jgi:hypothetical protein